MIIRQEICKTLGYIYSGWLNNRNQTHGFFFLWFISGVWTAARDQTLLSGWSRAAQAKFISHITSTQLHHSHTHFTPQWDLKWKIGRRSRERGKGGFAMATPVSASHFFLIPPVHCRALWGTPSLQLNISFVLRDSVCVCVRVREGARDHCGRRELGGGIIANPA